MAFSVKHPEADVLVRELTAITGESLTAAVTTALRERLERCRLQTTSKASAVDAAADHLRRLPVIDDVRADDVLRWDEIGLPR